MTISINAPFEFRGVPPIYQCALGRSYKPIQGKRCGDLLTVWITKRSKGEIRLIES